MNSNEIAKTDLLHTIFHDALGDAEAPQSETELAALRRVVKALPYSLELQSPPSKLRLEVLSSVREYERNAKQSPSNTSPAREHTAAPPIQLWKNWTNATVAGDLTIQRKEAGAWEKTGVEGVEVKQLFVDQARDYVTMLVRMAPGSSYPRHRHGGFEECYVLEGDLSVGDTMLFAGDYQRAEGGSVHGIQATQKGCLLFIVSSQQDELLV